MSDGTVPIFRLRVTLTSESDVPGGSVPSPPPDSDAIQRRKAMYQDRFNPPVTSAKSKSRSFGPTPKPQEGVTPDPPPPPPPPPSHAAPSQTPLAGAIEFAKTAPELFVLPLGIGLILGSCFRLGAAASITAAMVLAAFGFVTYTLIRESLTYTPGLVVFDRGIRREYPVDAESFVVLLSGLALGLSLGFGFGSGFAVVVLAILLVLAIRHGVLRSEP